MSPKLLFPLPALALLLGGCAVSKYCEGEQPYQTAPSVAPLSGVEGLRIPESASALRIPPPPAQAVPYAQPYKDEDGDETVLCLDRPPEMPMPAQAPEAPASAPVAPASEAPPPAAPASEVPAPETRQE